MQGRRGRIGFGVTNLQCESAKPRSQAHTQSDFGGRSALDASGLEAAQLVKQVHRNACQVGEHAMAVYDVFDTDSIRAEGCICHVLRRQVKSL